MPYTLYPRNLTRKLLKLNLEAKFLEKTKSYSKRTDLSKTGLISTKLMQTNELLICKSRVKYIQIEINKRKDRTKANKKKHVLSLKNKYDLIE